MPYDTLLELDDKMDVVQLRHHQIEFNEEDGEPVVRFDDTTIPLDNSLGTVSKAFGIPESFARSLMDDDVDLLLTNFNRLGQNHSRDDIAYNWGIDHEYQKLFTYGPSNKPYIKFGQVGEILEEHGMDINGMVGDRGVGILTGTSPTRGRVEPRVGDEILSGLQVHLDPLMHDNPMVLPWSERLVCTNGMTTLDYRGETRIPVINREVDEVLEQINAQAELAFSYAEQLNHSFASLVDEPVHDRRQAMRNLMADQNIPHRVRPELVERAMQIDVEPVTIFDLMNIITYWATHETDGSRSRLRYQAGAGDNTIRAHLHCNSCGSELR